MTFSGTNREKKGGQRVAVVFYALAALLDVYKRQERCCMKTGSFQTVSMRKRFMQKRMG